MLEGALAQKIVEIIGKSYFQFRYKEALSFISSSFHYIFYLFAFPLTCLFDLSFVRLLIAFLTNY